MIGNIEKTEIANGVRACTVKVNHFKTNVMSMHIVLPLTSDMEANALLCYMLRRRTAKYPTMTALNRRLAELYGASLACGISKHGDSQDICFRIVSVSDRFSLENEAISKSCTELLLDVLFNPKLEDGKFIEEDIELEKRLLIEKIDSEFSEKRVYAKDRLIEEMFEGSLYAKGRFGSRDEIKNVTNERLINAWKNYLENAIIQFNFVGEIDDEAIHSLKEKFSKIDRSHIVEINSEFKEKADNVKKVDEKLAVKQGKLVMGLRTGMKDEDDNFFQTRVMCDMFGGGPYSKLFTNVREKMSLCYYCSASLSKDKGIIIIQSGIEDENEKKATDAILDELQNMKNASFTEEDILNSKNGLCDAYMSVGDTPEGIDAWIGARIFEEDITLPEDYAQNVRNVTAEEIKQAAQRVSLDTIYMLSSDGSLSDEEMSE